MIHVNRAALLASLNAGQAASERVIPDLKKLQAALGGGPIVVYEERPTAGLVRTVELLGGHVVPLLRDPRGEAEVAMATAVLTTPDDVEHVHLVTGAGAILPLVRKLREPEFEAWGLTVTLAAPRLGTSVDVLELINNEPRPWIRFLDLTGLDVTRPAMRG